MMIGDSLAVGVGQARPECETVAKVGITSGRYLTSYMPGGQIDVTNAVISLGVNDDTTVDTLENLRAVRARITSHNVIWLLPGLKPNVRDIIRIVAEENGDRTLDTRPQAGRDHLHPNGTGYQVIAAAAFGPSAAGDEVASYEPPTREDVTGSQDIYRPLHRYATPKERIHRLRQLRHAEVFTSLRATLHDPYHGHAVSFPRSSYQALPLPPMLPGRAMPRREHAAREPAATARHGRVLVGCSTAHACLPASRTSRG